MTGRLLLVGGPGGSGASTLAARIADAHAEAGSRVAVIDTDPEFGATRAVTQDVTRARPRAPRVDDAQAFLARAGVDPDLVPALGESVAGVLPWWGLPDLLVDHDLVVADVGSGLGTLHLHARSVELLAREVSAVAAGAAWSSWARALGGRPRSVQQRLAGFAARARTRIDGLAASGTAVVVVAAPGELGAAKTRAVCRGVALGGGRLATVVGEVTGALDDELRAHGIESRDPLDVPVGTVFRPRLHGSPGDDRVRWQLPVPFCDEDSIDVAIGGDLLSVTVAGRSVLHRLPGLLSRYTARGTRVRQGILEVAFTTTEGAR